MLPIKQICTIFRAGNILCTLNKGHQGQGHLFVFLLLLSNVVVVLVDHFYMMLISKYKIHSTQTYPGLQMSLFVQEVDLVVPNCPRTILYHVVGFVDAHTHPVWAGDRIHEFSMKVKHLIMLPILCSL